jgi:hypothetical protein
MKYSSFSKKGLFFLISTKVSYFRSRRPGHQRTPQVEKVTGVCSSLAQPSVRLNFHYSRWHWQAAWAIATLILIVLLAGCSTRQAASQVGTAQTPSSQNGTTQTPASQFGTAQTPVSLIGTAQTAPAISSQNISASIDENNSLICHIQGSVDTPGKVTVQYWSEKTGPFISAPVTTQGTSFSLEVMRLRPSTQYNFEVFLSTSSSFPVSQYQGTFTTGPLPAGLQDSRITDIQGTPSYDLLFLDYNCTNFNGMVAIDHDGQIVWYYQNDNQVFTLAQEDNHNVVFNELSLGVGYTMKEIAPDGVTVHSIDDTLDDGSVCAPHGRWNHEMLVRPGNKVWTIGAEIRPVTLNGKDTLQTGGTIEEWDITKGTVTRLVSLFDLLDPVNNRTVDSDVTGGFFWMGNQNQYSGEAEDWTHSNSLEVIPNGDILMSNRHLDQVIAIKPDFSGVDWKLGGYGSDFKFPNPADQFYHQHDVKMLPNGDLLLFDNGNLRPDDQGGQYSRAEELKLDFSTMQATKVWEYRYTPDLFSSAVGSVFRLNNGNTVVDFGVDTAKDDPLIFTVVEADLNGNAAAVTRISSPGKGDQYRAIPADSLNGETIGSVLTGP